MSDVVVTNRDAVMSQMLFQANKKSMGVAHLLWIFFGGIGGHRFYAGRSGSAVAMLLLTMLGWIMLLATATSFVLLFASAIWALVDAFLIPGWIRNSSNMLAHQLTR